MLALFEERGFRLRRCTWELTLACDLRCGHCGSRAGRPRADELSTDEAFTVCDDLARLGCRAVTLAGGEPTLRDDWPQLVARLRGHGMKVSMLSNGFGWGAEQTARALQAGVSQGAFSLDGMEEAHDANRAPGSFAKVCAAIKACREAGLRVSIVTHVTRANMGDLRAMQGLLSFYGVSNWQLQQGVPIGNLSEHRERVLDKADILVLVPLMAELARLGGPRLVAGDNLGYYGPHEIDIRGGKRFRLPFWLGCRAGIEVVGIESHGDVKGCLSLPSSRNGRRDFIEGNVRERSLWDIWRDPASFSFNRTFDLAELQGDCAGCEYGEICRGGCTLTSVGFADRRRSFPNCYHAAARAAASEEGDG